MSLLEIMTTLTGNKATDVLIVDYLTDRALLNFCISSPDTSICSDDNFWRNRLFNRQGRVEKSPNKSWKTFYLQMVYYTDKGKDKGKDDVNESMRLAAKGGHQDLVDFFIQKGAKSWNWGMRGAAEGGHWNLVDFFIDKNADDNNQNNWNLGMNGAALGGHPDLVDFFIQKGAYNWNLGMKYAAMGGHQDLVDFFQQKLNQEQK